MSPNRNQNARTCAAFDNARIEFFAAGRLVTVKETLIKPMPRVFTADLTHLFGEKPRDTTRLG
jgi:hypothetical protein